MSDAREALVEIIRHARTDPDKPAYYQPDCYAADLVIAAGWVPAAPLRALVADWQANGNSRELGDPTDTVWFECARQLLAALDGQEGQR